MMKINIKIFILSIAILLTVIFNSCSESYSPEQKKYIASREKLRLEKDEYMKNNPNSPFNYKGKIEFHPLNYYDIDPDFVFHSRLNEYTVKDTIAIFGTKGEERKAIRFGFVEFEYKNLNHRLNVYKGSTQSGEEYYSIWFTDLTTNDESYGVGRYLDFEINRDPGFIYTIDFNLAYNPYCAYSPDYTCAIPTKEDHLNLAITAGEKKYHN